MVMHIVVRGVMAAHVHVDVSVVHIWNKYQLINYKTFTKFSKKCTNMGHWSMVTVVMVMMIVVMMMMMRHVWTQFRKGFRNDKITFSVVPADGQVRIKILMAAAKFYSWSFESLQITRWDKNLRLSLALARKRVSVLANILHLASVWVIFIWLLSALL
jgi:hypothetical protein